MWATRSWWALGRLAHPTRAVSWEWSEDALLQHSLLTVFPVSLHFTAALWLEAILGLWMPLVWLFQGPDSRNERLFVVAPPGFFGPIWGNQDNPASAPWASPRCYHDSACSLWVWALGHRSTRTSAPYRSQSPPSKTEKQQCASLTLQSVLEADSRHPKV